MEKLGTQGMDTKDTDIKARDTLDGQLCRATVTHTHTHPHTLKFRDAHQPIGIETAESGGIP